MAAEVFQSNNTKVNTHLIGREKAETKKNTKSFLLHFIGFLVSVLLWLIKFMAFSICIEIECKVSRMLPSIDGY